jgi:hypothetical protein
MWRHLAWVAACSWAGDVATANQSIPAAQVRGVEESSARQRFAVGELPTVTVVAPAAGASFSPGEAVSFSGSASDLESGDLSSTLAWTSSLDGSIGTGASFSSSSLSLGAHAIRAEATDGDGQTSFAQVTIYILPSEPVLVAAGDIANCNSQGDEATAALLDNIPGTVLALGDTVYQSGTLQEYNNCYAPYWGRHKARTLPTSGNHEYLTPGAAGYYEYFGAAAGDPSKGYYSYDFAGWHVVVFNSECASVGGCSRTSPQGQWVQADLAAHPAVCTLAYWHKPRFSSRNSSSAFRDFWQLLQEAGADLVLSAHVHNYERFAPRMPWATPTRSACAPSSWGPAAPASRPRWRPSRTARCSTAARECCSSTCTPRGTTGSSSPPLAPSATRGALPATRTTRRRSSTRVLTRRWRFRLGTWTARLSTTGCPTRRGW